MWKQLFLATSLSLAWWTSAATVCASPGDWIGLRFTILPLASDEQANGYPFLPATADTSWQLPNGNLRYERLAGKQAIVRRVIPVSDSQNTIWQITLEEESSGQDFTLLSYGDVAQQLVLTDDLSAAKAQFSGRTIYSKVRLLGTLLNPNTGQPTPPVFVSIGEPLAVLDVWPGLRAQTPIWLVCQTQTGQRGYLPISYSLTNASASQSDQTPPWQRSLFLENPRQIYRWPETEWTKIQNSEIWLGMQHEQTELSWGEPLSKRWQADEKGTTFFVWRYPTHDLYFTGNALTFIRVLDELSGGDAT